MSSFADDGPGSTARLDGLSADELGARLGLPLVALFESVGSTLDIAHRFAADAPAGTLIVAEEQTAGRGRYGRQWASAPGAGLWLTMIERPTDARALDVMALRCGLYAAESLDVLAGTRVCVKWPNDLYVAGRKLAGILIETRWRGTAPEWVAIGMGINLVRPELDGAIGLTTGVNRLAALEQVVPAIRRAAAASRHLSADELSRWAARDVAAGRAISQPSPGRAEGIESDGQLVVTAADGSVSRYRSGSLTFAGQAPLTCS